jgi:hypothetical protein
MIVRKLSRWLLVAALALVGGCGSGRIQETSPTSRTQSTSPSVSGNQTPPASRGPGQAARTGPASPGEQELIQSLGVLRRPQTRADLRAMRLRGQGGALPDMLRVLSRACGAGNPSVSPWCSLELEKPFVRTVRAGGGYEVAIFPTAVERSTSLAPRGEAVMVSLRGPAILFTSSGRPRSTGAFRAAGILLSAYVDSGVNRGVILVPDGVTRVTLGSFHLIDQSTRAPVGTTSLTVKDNVGLFQLNGITEQDLQLGPRCSRPLLLPGIWLWLPDHVRDLRHTDHSADDLVQRRRQGDQTHQDPNVFLCRDASPGPDNRGELSVQATPAMTLGQREHLVDLAWFRQSPNQRISVLPSGGTPNSCMACALRVGRMRRRSGRRS